MAIAGAAYGAARGLEEIVAERMLRQKLEAEIADREQRAAMEQQRMAETTRHNEWERGRADNLDTERSIERQRVNDREATERNARSDMAAVLAMPGMSAEAKRNEIIGSGVRTGTLDPARALEATATPKKREYTYTDPKTGAKSLRYAEAGDQPIDLGRDPEKPSSATPHYLTLIDPTGKQQRRVPDGAGVNQLLGQGWRIFDEVAARQQNGSEIDPVKAKEKGVAMLEAARALRNHPGLGNLTGARIGNPDYMLGVSEEPVSGSKAADAASYHNRLKALMTTENLGLMKGVLSETDMKIIQAASSQLDTKMQDATFVAELDKVIQKLEAAFGGGGQASASLSPMSPTSSRGTGQTPSSRVDDLIKKYGGGGV